MDNLTNATAQLREALVNLKKSDTWGQIVTPKEGVFARFGPLLQPSHITALTEEEIRPFFYFEHNHHWTGLFRQVNRLCSDMPRLRQVLTVLLDESQPIDSRLDQCGGAITGLGKGIMTAILTVAYPEKYGVWNNVSEDGMFKVGIWPDFPRGTSLGTKYLQINQTLTKLKEALQVDFWTLDAVWWQLGHGDETPITPVTAATTTGTSSSEAVQRFGLERHLQDFLYDNWASIELGQDWVIYSEKGEPDAGYEYTCGVGRIDILARHRTLPKWLVIELKREDTSDEVVGQALRYMGWVRKHLAESNEEVHGLIIARVGDEALSYAVSAVPNLKFMTYAVEFKLNASSLPS